MARKKIAYIGGGSSRAAGTMASFVHHGSEFDGSEFVLIDVDPEHLELVRSMSEKMARAAGLDYTITATTDQREGLRDVDAVLTSFRPGNFASRVLDERIPLKYGVIGQETQGPGGMMMSLRSIHFYQGIVDDLNALAPGARIFNYTNPVNIVSQAVTRFTDIPMVSFCEGPIYFPATAARGAGLDPDRLTATMVGVNHNCWSVEASYDGRDAIEVLGERWEALKDEPLPADPDERVARRVLEISVAMGSLAADYYQYYYFADEILRELQLSRRTRAEFLLDNLPDYWNHYREQAASDNPVLDPARSRGGIHELELAIDAMNAYYNDTGDRLPFNVPNTGRVMPDFDEDVVVEVWGTVDSDGFHSETFPQLPHPVRGITQQLAEYQYLAAEAAWRGTRKDAIRAMVANPLVPSLHVAEALYDEMAHAHRAYLPDRLLS
ncbi:MAG: hypothetical protein QM635_10585 [Microbacteriaceae bacterium]